MTSTATDSRHLVESTEAIFSPDRAYRYRLTRTWDTAAPPLVVIGLNPSTADSQADDPTTRRVRTFARRENAGGLVLVNLYALRSTNPKALRTAADPVGPDNDEFIRAAMAHGTAIAAWGAEASDERAEQVLAIAAELDVTLYCLGRTRDGYPRHPLYLAAGTNLEIYTGGPQ